jgi:glycyl-tRNA synthetase beta chain
MFNDKVLNCEALGLVSGHQTSGHRFMSNGKLTIPDASKYLETLKNDGKVVAEFAIRRNLIEQQLATKAAEFDLKISPMDGLLDEVTALVEWPEVLVGSFDKKFLDVPQECLILSMAKNQKYFALVDGNNKLSNKFLFVANLISKDPQVIIEGNQKVLSARLADAEFFYNFDKRTPLANFVKRMTNVVYHNKLGSQYERIERLQKIAHEIALRLQIDAKKAERAAYLLKADLATEMVGEFPELQGIMGNYYALASGESTEIANAIEQHYYPRFSGDELPNTPLATVVSLADKLETLVGIWGIGLIPTGDKDPYALRRAALGIVRILLESEYASELKIDDLLEISVSSFSDIDKNVFNITNQQDIYVFILQRLENFLLTVKNLPKNIINAIMYSYYNENTNNKLDLIGVRQTPSMRGKINFIDSLSNALTVFANDSKAHKITQASKRMVNILKKNEELLSVSGVRIQLLSVDGADRQLFNHHEQEMRRLDRVFNAQQWDEFFEILLTYADLIETFFNDVTIVTDDIAATDNRLNLLFILARHFNMACRLSELA